ncbi:metal-dependent hydrolase [Candidatus Woesearchaeota archaeon]|nr:metal-dependent hydrolase [Candidatus Woesearchaeota archaeon]
MDPQTHFLFPFTLSVLLIKLHLFSWQLALLAGIIGVIIDLDHYAEQIAHAKTNRFSLKATWNNAVRFHRFNQRSFIHDGIGAILITIVLCILAFLTWQVALALALGYYSHLLLDYARLKHEKEFCWRLGSLYMKESHLEIILDILLVIILVIFFLI